MNLLRRKKAVPEHRYTDAEIPAEENVVPAVAAPEVAAVIALSLNMYVQQIREYEQAIITIQKVIKPYSPWSSKIYGIRQTPNHIHGLRTRLK